MRGGEGTQDAGDRLGAGTGATGATGVTVAEHPQVPALQLQHTLTASSRTPTAPPACPREG